MGQPPVAVGVLIKPIIVVLMGAMTVSGGFFMPRNARTRSRPPMETLSLISHWGYPSETHTIVTDDGYILDVHRIPGPRGSASPGSAARITTMAKIPVLLLHGYGASSENMVLRQHKNLAFMLADADLDVWLGNFRGNTYGLRHVTLTTADYHFWDFGWHENGVHDIPGMVDYIIERTGQRSVVFIGHSMGATALFALLADRPDYNDKIRAAFHLAPAVYFHHVRGAFRTMRMAFRGRTYIRGVLPGFSPVRTEDIFSRSPHPEPCLAGGSVTPNCFKFFTNAQGPFHSRKNNTYMSNLIRHWPRGASTAQSSHFGQLIISGDGFFKYDYGTRGNWKKYGRALPPAYNLTNIRCPTFIFYSRNDYQAHYKDIKKLATDLPGLAGLFLTPFEHFNHLDLMFEEDAADTVFIPLIEEIKKLR